MSQSAPLELASTLADFLRRQRFRLSTEKILQADMEGSFRVLGRPFTREYRFPDGDIPDFFFPVDGGGGVALEVKIRGSKRAIYDQCVRYCGHSETRALVLATNVALGFPESIDGRPCFVASLGRGWL